VGYLRILLALCVAVGHLQSHLYSASDSTIIFVGPAVAVKLFFIISGFYMAMIFHKHYATTGMFLVSRAVRLFPAYWLTIAFCVAAALWFRNPYVGPFLNLDFWSVVRTPAAAVVSFTLSNLTFLGIDFSYFICYQPTPATHFSFIWDLPCPDGQSLLLSHAVVPAAWTLSLEWYFYLLVPLFCSLNTRRVAVVAGSSFLLAVAIVVFTNLNPWHQFGNFNPLNRGFFPAELYLFLLGFLAYRLRDVIPKPMAATCVALGAVVILGYQHIPVFDWQNLAGANFVLYFVFALALPKLFELGSRIPGERLAGDLSYPIYICHGAVQSVILALALHEQMSLFMWLSANVLIVMIASALLLVVTAPIEKFRLRFKSARPHKSLSAQPA
jgi:peptidoglycan/LPS O-acetylase OafA/YrhL